MKVVIQSIIERAADLYKYILIPPSLENTRQRRRRIEERLSNKPNSTIKKKYRKQKISTKVPAKQNGQWAVSKNESKGIYVATKIVEPDVDVPDNTENDSLLKPTENDQTRILELEKQLEELKRSLAAIPTAPSTLPTPPESKMAKGFGSEMMTPSLNTPPVADRVPAPDFDQLPTPKVPSNIGDVRAKSLHVPSIPTPPPPPPIPATNTLTYTQLCKTVPSGLHRTQSINDLIVSGEASKSVLRRVEINRSPGGTPVKTVQENFLAKALRMKFQSASSPKSPHSPSADKENRIQNNCTPKKRMESEVSDSEWDSPTAY